MDVFSVTRTLLADANILIDEIEKNKTVMPPVLNDPYTLLYMVIDTLKYQDEIYTGFIMLGMGPKEAAESTREAIKSKSQELMDSTKPNVIPFRKKDN